MAKMFLDPQILECDIENTEGLHPSQSGGIEEFHGDWDITLEYRNHNTGSHSEVAFIGVHHGNHAGEVLKMDVIMKNGFEIKEVRETSGCVVTNLSKHGFTITRRNHFNPTERFEFNIQVVVSNGPVHPETHHIGAIGKTGEYRACDLVCVRYEES